MKFRDDRQLMMIDQLFRTALQQHQAGRLPKAEALYRQILEQQPNHPDALHLLGAIARQMGEKERAAEYIGKAITASPAQPVYYNSMGLVLRDQGRLDEAAACYRQALALRPNYSESYYNLANVLQIQGKLDEAVACYQKAVLLNPNDAEAYNNMGKAFLAQDRHDKAMDSYRKALAIEPNHVEALNNLGKVLQSLGRSDEALASYRRALMLKPDYAKALSNVGRVLQVQGKVDEALASYRQAILIKPDMPETYCYMGKALRVQGNLTEAVASFQKALALDPDSSLAYHGLAEVYREQGRPQEAISCYRKALSIRPDSVETHSSLLLAMQYTTDFSAPEIFAEHLRFAQQFESPLKPLWSAHQNVPDANKRLKVGYVSGDFRQHSVASFIEPIISSHDKNTIEVYCYYNHPKNDHISDRIAASADHWFQCFGLKDDELADRIRNDGIDILVDLSGHTSFNRLLTFARKPAPIQMTWIGYPGTTGLAAMDYRLTDEYLDPAGMTEQFHTETLLRLPSSCTFQPSAESPPVNALPALACGYFTLASLNNLLKVNRDTIRLWARILLALPNARLMLGNATGSQTQQRLASLFAQEGISADRLIFHPRMPTMEYLALHHQIDLALDPFPYNGGTTTGHSLWMGVPVITLAGDRTVSRSGNAILSNFGLTECIARSEQEYFDRVLEFARDLPRLEQLRQSLRQIMTSGQNIGALGLTQSLEAAYRAAWHKWCRAR